MKPDRAVRKQTEVDVSDWTGMYSAILRCVNASSHIYSIKFNKNTNMFRCIYDLYFNQFFEAIYYLRKDQKMYRKRE